MHSIHKATNAKVRVRGRGSGHLEAGSQMEAPVPLMVAVTSEGVHKMHFTTAVQMTIERLSDVQKLWKTFCDQRDLGDQLARERIWRFGEMSKEAETLLADLVGESITTQGDYWSQRPPGPLVKFHSEREDRCLPQPAILAPGVTPPPPPEAPPPNDWPYSFMGGAYDGFRGYGNAAYGGSQMEHQMNQMPVSGLQADGTFGISASAAAAAALQNFAQSQAYDMPPGLPPGLGTSGADWGSVQDSNGTGACSLATWASTSRQHQDTKAMRTVF